MAQGGAGSLLIHFIGFGCVGLEYFLMGAALMIQLSTMLRLRKCWGIGSSKTKMWSMNLLMVLNMHPLILSINSLRLDINLATGDKLRKE